MDTYNEADVSPPDHRVIFHARNPGLAAKASELSTILDLWELHRNNPDDPVPDTLLQTAVCGSSFGGPSPHLTLRQLFATWENGKLIHSSYFDGNGVEIHEKLNMVGFGVGLSGAFVFWGIVTSQNTVVISDHSPVSGACNIATGMQIYQNASMYKGISG